MSAPINQTARATEPGDGDPETFCPADPMGHYPAATPSWRGRECRNCGQVIDRG